MESERQWKEEMMTCYLNTVTFTFSFLTFLFRNAAYVVLDGGTCSVKPLYFFCFLHVAGLA